MSQTARIVIYCHTHRASGRKYVGQTSDTLENRWKSHAKGHSGAHAFHRAIREYGPDAFDHETLEVVEGHEAGNEAEARWIRTLDCQLPRGFNVLAGGAGKPTRHKYGKFRTVLAREHSIMEISLGRLS
jgi:hypothetical protein